MKNSGNLARNLDAAKDHILFQHDPSITEGWITLARKDKNTHRFYQRHYKPDELAHHLAEWTGEDVYYSQNTFFKPQRRIDNIRQLKTLYVDLDVYNKGLTPEWVLGKLELEYFGQTIPNPNIVIFSGRGLVLIWNIEPIPHMVMPLWRAVENFFLTQLKDLGADSKAADPARVFRLPGTINSKNAKTVTAQYRHTYRYDIHQLQYDYLPELTPTKVPKKGRKSKVINLFNLYTLHLSRAKDIAKLVELREGNCTGYRETLCFLYRYFTCCYTSDPEKALEDALSLNQEFTRPLPVKAVTTATKSAQKAWEAKNDKQADEIARSMGYPGAGYNLKNSKIIEWLEITPEEQKELSTIIGAQEKRRRNLILKEKQRRDAGVPTRKEYEKSKKQKSIDAVQEALQENPKASLRKLAEITGMSVTYVRKIKQEIQAG